MDVVCVGDCGVDLYLPGGERRFGGITANFARHAADLFPGTDSIHVLSCVGDDDGARVVRDGTTGTRVHWHLPVLPGRTPVQTIEVHADGEKHFTHYDEGVLRDLSFDADARALIGRADLLVAPVYLQIVDLFGELLAVPTSGLVAIDFADFLEHPDFSLLTRHIATIDIGFFGLAADDDSAIEAIADLATEHDRLFVVTLGAAGSLAFRGKERFRCEAAPVARVVDTTGAGDAYAAAFLASYCHGVNVQDAMRAAARVAAAVVGRLGSYPIEPGP